MARLIYIHIEKAAGTSIRQFLNNQFGEKNIYWHGVNVDEIDLNKFCIIGGHKNFSAYKDLPAIDTYFTSVIRQPRDRIISLYNYYNEKKITSMLNSEGFDSTSIENTLINCTEFQENIENAQCYYLSCTKNFEVTLAHLQNRKFFVGNSENISFYENYLNKILLTPSGKIPVYNAGVKGYENKIQLSERSEAIISSLTEEDLKLYTFITHENNGIFSSLTQDDFVKLKDSLSSLKSDNDMFFGFFEYVNIPSFLNKNQTFKVDYSFINTSYLDWNNKERRINISYHWLSKNGEIFNYEGLRSAIDLDLILHNIYHSGTANILTPDEPGLYILEMSIVFDGLVWLEQRGFEVTRQQIEVC